MQLQTQTLDVNGAAGQKLQKGPKCCDVDFIVEDSETLDDKT